MSDAGIPGGGADRRRDRDDFIRQIAEELREIKDRTIAAQEMGADLASEQRKIRDEVHALREQLNHYRDEQEQNFSSDEGDS